MVGPKEIKLDHEFSLEVPQKKAQDDQKKNETARVVRRT
jgi:hypothetical protein